MIVNVVIKCHEILSKMNNYYGNIEIDIFVNIQSNRMEKHNLVLFV